MSGGRIGVNGAARNRGQRTARGNGLDARRRSGGIAEQVGKLRVDGDVRLSLRCVVVVVVDGHDDCRNWQARQARHTGKRIGCSACAIVSNSMTWSVGREIYGLMSVAVFF